MIGQNLLVLSKSKQLISRLQNIFLKKYSIFGVNIKTLYTSFIHLQSAIKIDINR